MDEDCLLIQKNVPILEHSKEAGDHQACVSLSLLNCMPSMFYVLTIFSMLSSGEHYHNVEKGGHAEKTGAANRVPVMTARLGHRSRTIHGRICSVP